jgi:hypothetical protein
MAKQGFSIGVAADTKPFSSAVKSGVLEPLQSVQDTLKQVTADGANAGEKLEQGFKGAQTATVDYERQITATNANVSRSSKRSYTQDTENFELSAREKKRLNREALGAISQNAQSVIGGFSGNLEDLASDAEGAAVGIVSGLGPIGLAVGSVAATALGIIQAAFAKGEAESKQFKADVGELTGQLIKMGVTGVSGPDAVNEKLTELAEKADDSGESLDSLASKADKAGISAVDLQQAYAGNIPVLKSLYTEGQKRLTQLNETAKKADLNTSAGRIAYRDAISQASGQRAVNDILQKKKDVLDAATKATSELSAAEKHQAASAKAAADGEKAFAEDVNSSTSSFITTNKKREESLKDFEKAQEKTLKKQAQFATDSAEIYQKYGAEVGAKILSEVKPGKLLHKLADAPPADVKRISEGYVNIGKIAATNVVDGAKAALPSAIKGPKVNFTTDVTRFISDTQRALDRTQFKLNTKVYKINGKPVI